MGSMSARSPAGGRRDFERRSAPMAFGLASRPRWLVALVALALLLTGLATEGPLAVAALLLLAGLLGWLASLSWPVTDPQGRLLRVAAVAVLVVVALPRF
jgi:hypothetical protein